MRFQSQNGLILTHNKLDTIPKRILISIPKWSDFNSWNHRQGSIQSKISIPKWSDFNLKNKKNREIVIQISIPKWSDFNVVLDCFMGSGTTFQSQNGLILTNKPYPHLNE